MLNIIETPTRRSLPERLRPPTCIVVHSTGQTDLDRILAYYTSASGLQPHYLVTATGSIRRHVDEMRVAYHAGLDPGEVQLYRAGWETWSRHVWKDKRAHDLGVEQPRYRSWRDQWRRTVAVQSPLDLVSGDRPNLSSVGIEVQSLEQPTKEVFEPAQYEALAALVTDVCQRWKIPLDREHVLGHYDVSPLRRSGVSGSYDPGERFSWARLWDLCRTSSR
jgi:N-acetyl-anhydromuramyl-L-alanine amidase AmpD